MREPSRTQHQVRRALKPSLYFVAGWIAYRSKQNASEELPVHDGGHEVPRIKGSIDCPMNLCANLQMQKAVAIINKHDPHRTLFSLMN